MVRFASVMLMGILVSGETLAQDYDIKKYCQKVATVTGGSYVIEKGCRDQENAAKKSLAGEKIEARIRSHCEEVARVTGGSYVIMRGCVDQEKAAKRALGRSAGSLNHS